MVFIGELVFLLLVRMDAGKVGFWRLKPIGSALTYQIEHDLLCDAEQVPQPL